MYYHKVEICGVNTASLGVLSDAEKRELLLRAQKGDAPAREALVVGNLRLVLSIIQRFSSKSENTDDLFQVGCIGLMKAIDHFNTDLDVKFSTYAVPMIIGEVRRYLRDNNAIRVSRSLRDIAYRALQARDILSKTLNHEPKLEEIEAYLKAQGETYSHSDIVQALDAIIEPISLYEPVFHDGGGGETVYVMDQLKDTENTDDVWLQNIALKQAMSHLNERERKIIDLRFFSGKTQMEIAEEIGISQAQVSRLEKGALSRIRKQL
jgi:RNA polymerase sporulation-specific sigma factor